MTADMFYQSVRHLLDNKIGWSEIGLALDMSAEAARCRYRREKKKRNRAPDPLDALEASEPENIADSLELAQVFFPDRRAQKTVDWRELIDLAITSQEINHRLDDEQRIATVEIKTDKPVAVMFSGEVRLVKCGTFQASAYGWRYFHNTSQSMPTIVFHPDSHKKVAFLDPVDAVSYLKMVRKESLNEY